MLVVISHRPLHSPEHAQHTELALGAARVLHRHNYRICVTQPVASHFSAKDDRVLHLPQLSDPSTLHQIRCEAKVYIFSHGDIDEATHLICSLRQRGINPADYALVFLGYHSFDRDRLADFLGMPNTSNIHCLEPCSALNELPGLLVRLIPNRPEVPPVLQPATVR